MIVGIGIDVEEIARIGALAERWGQRFVHRIFTEGEREFCLQRAHSARHFAARFAAKEAALKALCVPRGLSWHQLEVRGGGDKPPRLHVSGKAWLAADALGVKHFHVSLTHTEDTAAAVVIAEA